MAGRQAVRATIARRRKLEIDLVPVVCAVHGFPYGLRYSLELAFSRLLSDHAT
jgi:hypothetical protein